MTPEQDEADAGDPGGLTLIAIQLVMGASVLLFISVMLDSLTPALTGGWFVFLVAAWALVTRDARRNEVSFSYALALAWRQSLSILFGPRPNGR